MTTPASSAPIKPSLSQQLGLRQDPNALEHSVSHTGAKVTRFESAQPGLPTYHRRIANPLPLVFLCLGAWTILYGCLLVEVRGVTSWHIILNIGLPLCGPGLMAAAMFSFAEGSSYAATYSGVFSGALAGYSLTYLPWVGVESAFTPSSYPASGTSSTSLDQSLGVLFLIGMIPIIVLLVGSVRTALPISISTLFVVLAFILQGASLLNDGNRAVQYTSGAFFIIAGICFWYTCLAVLLQEEGIKVLPVFPLPRVD